MAEKNLNRIKVMLAEKGKTNKWLAEKLGRDQATISKWCTNACQPPLEALIQIAQCLEVDIKELIRVPEHNPYKELYWKKILHLHYLNLTRNVQIRYKYFAKSRLIKMVTLYHLSSKFALVTHYLQLKDSKVNIPYANKAQDILNLWYEFVHGEKEQRPNDFFPKLM